MPRPEKYNLRRYEIIDMELGKNEEIEYPEENFIEVTELYCTIFGCGKKLSRTEKLCGGICINHQIIKQKYGY